MRIKESIKKLIPSFRATQSVVAYCNYLSQKLDTINNRITELDQKNEYLFWISQKLSDETDMETRKRVFLNMPQATGTLRSIQLAENFLLQRIKKHTDELKINFFLMGGTALGAVRHKGFLPWDDDIDIGMFQEDYIRLKEKIDRDDDLITVNRYYQADGGSLIKVKYKFTENFFVDIFTFNYISLNQSQIEEFWKSSQEITKEYSKLIKQRMADLQLLSAFNRPIYQEELDLYGKDICQKYESLLPINGVERLFVSESIANGYSFRASRRYWEISDVFPIITDKVEFEGQTYGMIQEYEKRLGIFFGDIWSLPASINVHHNTEFDDNIEKEIAELQRLGII